MYINAVVLSGNSPGLTPLSQELLGKLLMSSIHVNSIMGGNGFTTDMVERIVGKAKLAQPGSMLDIVCDNHCYIYRITDGYVVRYAYPFLDTSSETIPELDWGDGTARWCIDMVSSLLIQEYYSTPMNGFGETNKEEIEKLSKPFINDDDFDSIYDTAKRIADKFVEDKPINVVRTYTYYPRENK